MQPVAVVPEAAAPVVVVVLAEQAFLVFLRDLARDPVVVSVLASSDQVAVAEPAALVESVSTASLAAVPVATAGLAQLQQPVAQVSPELWASKASAQEQQARASLAPQVSRAQPVLPAQQVSRALVSARA